MFPRESMPSQPRLDAIEKILSRQPIATAPIQTLEELWASDVFTLDKMKAARPTQIADISGMGSVKAQAFFAGLRTRLPLIERLLANGVRVKVQGVGPMTGLSVCMTGFRDAAMEQAIEAQGGTVKSSVGKGLSYLVAKDPNGASGKLDKARGMGVYVLSPADMWHFIGTTP